MLNFILASSSPYRKKILSSIISNFKCYEPNINEKAYLNERPIDLVKRLSTLKALSYNDSSNYDIIIASDQIATCGSKILGKPGNSSNAAKQLSCFSGKKVTFMTSVTVYRPFSKLITCIDKTYVYFNYLSNEDIYTYLSMEKPYDCAGSFKSERLGILLFKKIISSDPNSLIGLPLIKLNNILMHDFGVNLLNIRSTIN